MPTLRNNRDKLNIPTVKTSVEDGKPFIMNENTIKQPRSFR
jgi:hypothetical protein